MYGLLFLRVQLEVGLIFPALFIIKLLDWDYAVSLVWTDHLLITALVVRLI